MAEGSQPRETIDSNYLDYKFVGDAVFELGDPAGFPSLSTTLMGEEDPDEAVPAS